MVVITSVIRALKSSLRFLDRSVMVLVISLWSLVTSLVRIFVRSSLISVMIWSWRSFVGFCGYSVAGDWLVDRCGFWLFRIPILVPFGVFLLW